MGVHGGASRLTLHWRLNGADQPGFQFGPRAEQAAYAFE